MNLPSRPHLQVCMSGEGVMCAWEINGGAVYHCGWPSWLRALNAFRVKEACIASQTHII